MQRNGLRIDEGTTHGERQLGPTQGRIQRGWRGGGGLGCPIGILLDSNKDFLKVLGNNVCMYVYMYYLLTSLICRKPTRLL